MEPKRRIVASWIAWYSDFVRNEQGGPGPKVNHKGPTWVMHANDFELQGYERHILLASPKEDDTRSEILVTELRRHFPGRTIDLVYTNLGNIMDFREIRKVVERAIEPYRDCAIDFLYSAGTSPMRVVWVLLHLEQNGLETRLMQAVDEFVSGGNPKSEFLELDASIIAGRLDAVRQNSSDPEDPLIVDSAKPSYALAEKYARIDKVSVLIEGESGTGKERVARYIHRNSPRVAKSFFPVNCAAIDDSLLESRLFGYAKGSFTGAEKDQKGIFERAHGGTLFLDEIGDISPKMQQSLLRVLQEGKITRVGELKEREVDVRILAATHKNLRQECAAGRFRWDLYYRLVMARVQLPAFKAYAPKDRKKWFTSVLNKVAVLVNQRGLKLTQEATKYLMAYEFPGNLRELEHVIIQSSINAPSHIIDVNDLPSYLISGDAHSVTFKLEEVKAQHIRRIYESTGGNLSEAARLLDVAPNTVRKYLPPLTNEEG